MSTPPTNPTAAALSHLNPFNCFLTSLPAFSLILSNPSAAKGHFKCKYDQDLPLIKTLVKPQTKPSLVVLILCPQAPRAKPWPPMLQPAELLQIVRFCRLFQLTLPPLPHGLVGRYTMALGLCSRTSPLLSYEAFPQSLYSFNRILHRVHRP